jgi:hypothetical protein
VEPTRAVTPAPRAPGPWAWVGRIEDAFFPPRAGPSPNPRGVLSPDLLEWPAVALAFLIGLAVAAILEAIMLAQPIPPGGDPGEWTSTALAYAGLPYPSWIIPGQYPPLLFPVLGLLIRIGGGTAMGARLYVGVAVVLIGLSVYFLARSLTRRRATALVAEALVILNPAFLQMFFWGAYPNLFGFIFLNLSVAFLVRYIRSRRPSHLILFWACAAASLLTHSLVGVVDIATLAFVLVLAASIKIVPREVYRSKAGLAGVALFLGSVGGYYAATFLLGIHHPAYFQTGAFAYVKNGLGAVFYLLARPFVPRLTVPLREALPLLYMLVGGLVAYAIGLRLFWKHRMTLGTMVTIAFFLGTTGLALVGWELSVVTDYVRFGYFLVTPLALALALFLDWFMTGIAVRTAQEQAAAAAAGAPPGTPIPTPRWRRPVDPPAAVGVFVVGALIIVFLSGTVTLPALPTYEQNNTKIAHDGTFLTALQMIRNSGVQGSVLTVPGAAKWSRSLLVRDAYSPNLPARYTFDASHLVDEETAYFAMTTRYAATNGVVALTALGTNASDGNGTFAFQAAYYGVFNPVAEFPVGGLTVLVRTPNATRSEQVTAATSVTLAPPGQSWFQIDYAGPDFTVSVRATAVAASDRAQLLIDAAADPGDSLVRLDGNLTGPIVAFTLIQRGAAPGSLNLTPGEFSQALLTQGLFAPTGAFESVTPYNHLGTPAHATFRLNAPGGSNASLSLAITFVTPGASNLIRTLPSLFSTDAIWENWTVRFVLYTNSTSRGTASANLLPNEVQYLESEYGGQVLGVSGRWTVILLPPPTDLPGIPTTVALAPG